jgi:hypothetical protein
MNTLFKFTLVLNSALLFLKLLALEILLGMSETFLCSMSALSVKIIRLTDALQPLTSFVGTLTFLKQKLFLLIIYHNFYFSIISY